MEMNEESFEPSLLGTKNYWDGTYQTELENFESHGEEGEIWFGEKVQKEVVDYVVKNVLDKSLKIMDIGCGNGMLLILLAHNGFESLVGFDYSENAVKLAKNVAQRQSFHEKVNFFSADFLSEDFAYVCDIALDKGTFDAISLTPPESPEQSRRIYLESYKRNLIRSLKSKPTADVDFHFIVTSCNWTGEELCKFFQPEFQHKESIQRKSFSFGGSSGQTYSTVVFKLVHC